MFKPTIPGPDPDTKTPKFKLPPLSCDAHCHIFGPGSKYPYAPDRPYTPPDAPLEDFKALHAKLGVGRAVIVNASVHGTDNRVALDAIAQSGGAYRAVANIDDGITERGLRELHDGGFRGCRFNFVRHSAGTSICTSMRSIFPNTRTCWRACRCTTPSITWGGSRRQMGSINCRSGP